MTDHPADTVVLRALALFLEQDLRPAVHDRRLAFRVRVAAHLLTVIATQWDAASQRANDDLLAARLLLGDAAVSADEAWQRLASALRSGEVDEDQARVVLMERLRAELAVRSPAFDPDAPID